MGKHITLNRRGVVMATAPGHVPAVLPEVKTRNPIQVKLDEALAKIEILENQGTRTQAHLSKLIEENIRIKQERDTLAISLAEAKRKIVSMEIDVANAKLAEKSKPVAKMPAVEVPTVKEKTEEKKSVDLFDFAPPPPPVTIPAPDTTGTDGTKPEKKVSKKTSKRPK